MSRTRIVLTCTMAAAGCLTGAAATVAAAAPATVHVVQPGETLTGIARHAHTTVAAIEAANPGLRDPDRIRAGQHLTLPGVHATTPPRVSGTNHPTTPNPATGHAACQPTSTTWDGHRRFYDPDTGCYTSPWFTGTHRLMVPFGCTADQWYPHDTSCPGHEGKHHGIDVDMPIGTTIRTAVTGTAIVRPASMGTAYGRNGLIIRSGGHDYILGHLNTLNVRNGQHVTAGQTVGLSGDSGAETEDGPQLHFEVRPAGTGYTHATNPASALHLHRVQ